MSLLFVMNLGFAWGTSSAPPVSKQPTYLTIGIWIGIRVLLLACLLPLFS